MTTSRTGYCPKGGDYAAGLISEAPDNFQPPEGDAFATLEIPKQDKV